MLSELDFLIILYTIVRGGTYFFGLIAAGIFFNLIHKEMKWHAYNREVQREYRKAQAVRMFALSQQERPIARLDTSSAGRADRR